MITRFRVQNYKALRDVILELTPMHVLIGPNDSGKTSLLEAIAALSRSVSVENIADAFHGRWSGRDLVNTRSRSRRIVFEVEGNTSNDRCGYQLHVDMPEYGRELFAHNERYYYGGKSWSEYIKATDKPKTRSWLSLAYTDPYELHLPVELDEVHSLLGFVHTYRLFPNQLHIPTALDSSRQFRMHPTGFGLVLCLDDILGVDRKLFEKIEDQLRIAFPYIKGIKIKPVRGFRGVFTPAETLQLQEADGKGIYFDLEGSSQPVPASQMSDGVMLILAYLTILHLPEPPRFLLIEEPENGIHPARLEEVMKILRQIVEKQSHTQVIMTTHSPYVLSHFEPHEVTLCNRGEDGDVRVRRLSESKPVQEQIDFFTLGEIWTGAGDEALMEPVSKTEAAS